MKHFYMWFNQQQCVIMQYQIYVKKVLYNGEALFVRAADDPQPLSKPYQELYLPCFVDPHLFRKCCLLQN